MWNRCRGLGLLSPENTGWFWVLWSFILLWLGGAAALELYCFVPCFLEMAECVAGTPWTHHTCPGSPCPHLCCCWKCCWIALSGFHLKGFLAVVSLTPKCALTCCHKLTVVPLKHSLLLEWGYLSWLGGDGAVEVEFGKLCETANIPHK